MTGAEAVALGLVQGLTEFLPVSSSGHLALLRAAFGIVRPDAGLEVALHVGTLVAVVGVLGGRLRRGWRELVRPLAVASLPAGVVGLLLRPLAARMLGSAAVVGAGWVLTGLALCWGARLRPGGRGAASLRTWEALVIGLCQAVALVPGISRSGATLLGGLLLGLRPAEAAAFAFLLAIPSVGGAAVLHLAAWRGDGSLWLGAGVAAVSGAAAIRWLLVGRRRLPLRPFGVYCAALGAGVLAAALIGTAAPW